METNELVQRLFQNAFLIAMRAVTFRAVFAVYTGHGYKLSFW